MRASAALLSIGLLTCAACASPDHDALVARDAATGGAAGAGGVVVDAAPQQDVDVDAIVGDEDASDAATDTPVLLDSSFGPDGPSVFTFVHGVADAPHVRVCFHAEAGDAFEALDVPPMPDDPIGLPFAEALTGSALPGNIDLATTDVRPVVYYGALDQIIGISCSQLTTPPAGVQQAALGIIPAGTLANQRSVLMVAAGCVGGTDHVDSYQEQICGKGYASDKPTIRLLLASVDRTTKASAIGLQVFIGSVSSGSFDVDHLVVLPAKTTKLASGVLSGELDPRPPTFALSESDLGTDVGANAFRVFVDQAAEPGRIAYLPEALARGGLTLGDFADGANYTVVFVGPRPDVLEGAWWKSPELTVVRNDP